MLDKSVSGRLSQWTYATYARIAHGLHLYSDAHVCWISSASLQLFESTTSVRDSQTSGASIICNTLRFDSHLIKSLALICLSSGVEELRIYRVFQKELYNGVSSVTVRRVLWKPLHLKTYKLSIVQALLKHPALPVEAALNRNCPRQNSTYFATLWQFKTLCMSSE
jgi:hypothetical protein